MSVIVQVINNALRCVAAVIERLNLPEQRRKAASKALAKETESKAEAQSEVSTAVYSGDKDSVNKRLAKLLPLAAVCASIALSAGCVKTVAVYVPADREVVPMVHTNGVSGWFVPNATFDGLLKAAQRAKDLESQAEITARMEGKK
jgi:hypothetical protein